MKPKLVSLFSGCGGLDRGFEDAGFQVIWANEFDKKIIPTFQINFPETKIVDLSIDAIDHGSIPKCDGVIGGPPCQSFSIAGKQLGVSDSRGNHFFDFVDIVESKRPKFFLAENVQNFLNQKFKPLKIIKKLANLGYNVSCILLNANDFGVPQDRKRVFLIGYPASFGKDIFFEIDQNKIIKYQTLRDVIWNYRTGAVKAYKNKVNGKTFSKPNPRAINNHEYMHSSFSSHYMSRNRIRNWDEPSFTIQASGRHVPCHPRSKPFVKDGIDKTVFNDKGIKPRRLTVRECAAIQTFPDDFKFVYDDLNDGYKMIGNAVPVKMAKIIASQILDDVWGKYKKLPIQLDGLVKGSYKIYKPEFRKDLFNTNLCKINSKK